MDRRRIGAIVGYAIAHLAVRLDCISSELQQLMEKRWLQEPLPLAIERLLKNLHDNTQQAKALQQLSIARLDYCLPFFKVDANENAREQHIMPHRFLEYRQSSTMHQRMGDIDSGHLPRVLLSRVDDRSRCKCLDSLVLLEHREPHSFL